MAGADGDGTVFAEAVDGAVFADGAGTVLVAGAGIILAEAGDGRSCSCVWGGH